MVFLHMYFSELEQRRMNKRAQKVQFGNSRFEPRFSRFLTCWAPGHRNIHWTLKWVLSKKLMTPKFNYFMRTHSKSVQKFDDMYHVHVLILVGPKPALHKTPRNRRTRCQRGSQGRHKWGFHTLWTGASSPPRPGQSLPASATWFHRYGYKPAKQGNNELSYIPLRLHKSTIPK